MSRDSSASSAYILRTKPTLLRWAVEIREILNLNREASLSHFGGAAEYVKALLFNSGERAAAETYFDKALRQLIEAWHPIGDRSTERDIRLLQLVGAYTPSEAVGKLLVLLKSFLRLVPSGSNSRARALQPLVLQVLEQYFPANQELSGSFSEYVELLEAHLTYPEYLIYAVARLRAIKRLRPDHEGIGVALASAPQVLPSLLGLLGQELPGNRRDLEAIVSICRLCIRGDVARRGLQIRFREAAELHGLTVKKGNAGPILLSKEGGWQEEVTLEPPLDVLYYLSNLEALGGDGIRRKLDELRDSAKLDENPVSFRVEV